MRLSVGVFFKVLSLCLNSEETTSGLVRAIPAAIDPERTYNINDKYINGLVRCKNNLGKPVDASATGEMRFADVAPVARNKGLDLVEVFAEKIAPKISADKRENFVLAIKDIVGKDNEIDSVNPKAFEEYIGKPRAEFLAQNEIYLPEFLTRVFLYSLLEVDNTAGLGCEDDDDCPVKDAKSEAHLNPGKNRAVKPEQKEKIAEAINACDKDCVLRITEDYINVFDNHKGSLTFVDSRPDDSNEDSLAGKAEDGTSKTTNIISGDYLTGKATKNDLGSGNTFHGNITIGRN